MKIFWSILLFAGIGGVIYWIVSGKRRAAERLDDPDKQSLANFATAHDNRFGLPVAAIGSKPQTAQSLNPISGVLSALPGLLSFGQKSNLSDQYTFTTVPRTSQLFTPGYSDSYNGNVEESSRAAFLSPNYTKTQLTSDFSDSSKDWGW